MALLQFQALQSHRRESFSELFSQILSCREPAYTDFVLEVGCGHGHFLTAYAAHHRHSTCIGVDIAGDRIVRAQRKAVRAKLPNLHFFRIDASLLLEVVPATVTFTHVFVLFPDPWPKKRHHKHRVLQDALLTALASRAAPQCELHFRTDHQPYFDAARMTVSQSADWELANVPWPFEFATVFQNRTDTHHSFTARLARHHKFAV